MTTYACGEFVTTSRREADAWLTERYVDQVSKFPLTARVGLKLYVARNRANMVRNAREAVQSP